MQSEEYYKNVASLYIHWVHRNYNDLDIPVQLGEGGEALSIVQIIIMLLLLIISCSARMRMPSSYPTAEAAEITLCYPIECAAMP